MTTEKVNLLDLNEAALIEFMREINEPAYRGQQLLKWIHQFGVTDFSDMTNFSKSLRERLASIAVIQPPEIIYHQHSCDGTEKWLLQLSCGNSIETVFIPEDDRGTLCVSSQVGCALNCSFCATARQGFNRNLTVGEIIGQVWIAVRELSKNKGAHDRHVTNVVMMGMGEPLLNFDNVVSAMSMMLDDNAYGLSKRRVTLSTSGVVPAMLKLAKESPVSLAVSLHAPNDGVRNELVPINKKYPLKELMEVCKHYFANEPRRKVTFEYVMLAGVNDSPRHAKELVKLLSDVPAKLNLIPFNTFKGVQYECSAPDVIDDFRNILMSAGINTVTRKTRGDDIAAACGQLVGEVDDRTKRSQRYKKINTAVYVEHVA